MSCHSGGYPRPLKDSKYIKNYQNGLRKIESISQNFTKQIKKMIHLGVKLCVNLLLSNKVIEIGRYSKY